MLPAVSARTQTRDDTTGPKRTRDRELTEQRLVQAAIELLGSEGVLSGLNLRDVAERAGVARASIYNFFGNRRQLLRRALAIRIAELDDYRGVSTLPFVERRMRLVGDEDSAFHGQMVSLLVIDGDDEILPMPFYEQAMERMRADLENGDIHPDHAADLDALHVAIHTATRGYNVLRSAYARQMEISVEELDARIRPVFESWLRQLTEPRPN